jgi:hypothetical protein
MVRGTPPSVGHACGPRPPQLFSSFDNFRHPKKNAKLIETHIPNRRMYQKVF